MPEECTSHLHQSFESGSAAPESCQQPKLLPDSVSRSRRLPHNLRLPYCIAARVGEMETDMDVAGGVEVVAVPEKVLKLLAASVARTR